jgi:hypothetical protein
MFMIDPIQRVERETKSTNSMPASWSSFGECRLESGLVIAAGLFSPAGVEEEARRTGPPTQILAD